jgi:putative Mg2+ transporter-C (MgtC) family protein
MSDPSELAQIIPRLGCALAAGGVIGWEREMQDKPAGLRTNMLVALGAAVAVLAGLQLPAAGHAPEDGSAAVASRIIQGIVGGIGFLGAGTILQSRHSVHGLTTASALWLSAALGVSSGLGLYKLTFTAVALGIVVLAVFLLIEKRIRPNPDGGSFETSGEEPKRDG